MVIIVEEGLPFKKVRWMGKTPKGQVECGGGPNRQNGWNGTLAVGQVQLEGGSKS
jgi:hypothetical protein